MIAFGNRSVGQRVMEVDAGHADDSEGPALVMSLGPVVPDVVRIPAQLGGGDRRVLRSFGAPCPTDPTHSALHYELDGTVQVAECQGCSEFLWYRKP